MNYTPRIHLPQRLENLLNIIENNGNIQQFDVVVKDITEVIADKGFKQDLEDYYKERSNNIDNVTIKFKDNVKNNLKDNKFEDIIKFLNSSMSDYIKTVNEIYIEYMDVVKTYILGFVPSLEIKDYE